MDFVVNINSVEETFTQFDDAIEHIRSHLAQWNNFEDTNQPQVIIVYKKSNGTETLGVHSGEVVQTVDVFGRR